MFPLKINFVFIILIFQGICFSHTLLINTFDNENGTMDIEGVFSTGQIPQGAMLKLKSISTNKTLFEDRLNIEGLVTLPIPSEPYFVLMDSGPGHKIKREGTVKPVEGFKIVEGKKKIHIAFDFTLYLSLFFIFGSVVIHFIRVKRRNSF